MQPCIELTARPRLARRARLRFDRFSGSQVLLSPERGLLLSESAAAVVLACNGNRTVLQIVSELSKDLTDNSNVRADVMSFLSELSRRRLIEFVGEG